MVRFFRIALIVVAVAAISSCQMVQDLLGISPDDTSPSPSTDSDAAVFSSSLYRLEGVYEGPTTVEANLGSTGRDVYYIFTNASGSTKSVGGASSAAGVLWAPPERVQYASSGSFAANSLEPERREPPIRGLPPGYRTDFPIPGETDGDIGASSISPSTALSYDVGDSEILYADASGAEPVPATVRAVSSDGTREVYVWVENAKYAGTGFTDDSPYQELAERFLVAGDDNDIYDWITTVFGAPWGSQDSSYYIPPEYDDIHILVYDILEPNYAGFFFSKDNRLISSGVAGSNERLMFYIDLPLFATKDDATWEITDYHPQDMVSTLAHEFQHMINFYQLQLRRNPSGLSVDTWFNEMSSMVAEDLVADKLLIAGPRGVDPTDGSGGDNDAGGRLREYITGAALYPVTAGYPDDFNEAGGYYANWYSFGAYLSRSYGAALFKETMQQTLQETSIAGNGELAVRGAIEAVTGEPAPVFSELVRRWAVSMFVSDDSDVASPYSVNAGNWFTSSANGKTYNLGSIDLYKSWNYFEPAGSTAFWYWGPLIYHYDSSRIDISDLANAFFIRNEAGTGVFQDEVDLPDGVTLTVVSKAAE